MRALASQVLLCRREGLHFMSVEMYARDTTGGRAGAARCPSRVDVERCCGAMPVAGRCSARVGVSATRLTSSPLLGDTQCSRGCGWDGEVFLLSPYLGAGIAAPMAEAMAPVVGRQIWLHSQLGLSRSEGCSAQGRRGYRKDSRRHWQGFRGNQTRFLSLVLAPQLRPVFGHEFWAAASISF